MVANGVMVVVGDGESAWDVRNGFGMEECRKREEAAQGFLENVIFIEQDAL